MPWSFIIPAAASLIGGKMQADASRSAADTANAAADRAAELQRRMYEENVARQKPFYDVGVNALPGLVKASEYTPFSMKNFQQDPGYAFRLSEGQKQLDRQAASRGGLISGGALKAATRFGQEMGSQEYTNAFNRYQAEREARLRPLQALTGMGGTTANTLGTAGQTTASNIGNAYIGQGENTGNAMMLGAQTRASSYGNIAKLYDQNKPNFGNLFGGGGYTLPDPNTHFGGTLF
jgi:hypothetical protein